ncbi:MAG TPA: OmpA family protein [Myxococcales bacterium]|nr:OmpA family protein [Myxococcales bacterium]
MQRVLVVFLTAALGGACVTTSSHEKTIADLDQQHRSELEKTRSEDAAKLQDTEKKLAATEQSRKDLEAKLAEAQKRADELTRLLQGTTADRDKLDKLLSATNAQLDDLGKQKAAAEARAATYKSLTDRLRSMIDAGKLSVKIRKGRMLISLPNDVLFDSGSAVLKKAGQDAVAQVAQALAGIPDRQFLVAGHTDDRPIRSARFPSNWELSTERAVVVTRFLISKGMKPDALGALGYGEFDPLVPNDSDDHRAQNRRIEIQLQPNLSELPSMEALTNP